MSGLSRRPRNHLRSARGKQDEQCNLLTGTPVNLGRREFEHAIAAKCGETDNKNGLSQAPHKLNRLCDFRVEDQR
jgi:hypothetical protein